MGNTGVLGRAGVAVEMLGVETLGVVELRGAAGGPDATNACHSVGAFAGMARLLDGVNRLTSTLSGTYNGRSRTAA
jgi:hypothetical protein